MLDIEFHYTNKSRLDHTVDFFLQPYRYFFGSRDVYIIECASTVNSSYRPKYNGNLCTLGLGTTDKIHSFHEIQQIVKKIDATFLRTVFAIVSIIPATLIGLGLHIYGHLASKEFKSARTVHGLTDFYEDSLITQGRKDQREYTIVTSFSDNHIKVLQYIEYLIKTSGAGSVFRIITDANSVENNMSPSSELHYLTTEREIRSSDNAKHLSKTVEKLFANTTTTSNRIVIVPENNTPINVSNTITDLIRDEPFIQNDRVVVQCAVT